MKGANRKRLEQERRLYVFQDVQFDALANLTNITGHTLQGDRMKLLSKRHGLTGL